MQADIPASRNPGGVVFIHSAPQALCAHVQWALEQKLAALPQLEWSEQGAEPGTWRADFRWSAPTGTGSSVVSSLRGWPRLRFEVTEEATAAAEGSRWSHTPRLGLHHAMMGQCGDLLIGENQLLSAMVRAGVDGPKLQRELRDILGTAWDEELEPFRYAGQGAPVRWLPQVG